MLSLLKNPKLLRNLMMASSFCFIAISGFSQLERNVVIGGGLVATNNIPFNGNADYGWTSMIFGSAGFHGSDLIIKIGFYVNNSPVNYTMQNQRIWMRQTTATDYTSANYPGTAGFTKVYDGPITYNGSGWAMITLQTPFAYLNTSNLEVLCENGDGSNAAGFPQFRYTDVGANRVVRNFNNGATMNTGPGTIVTARPNTRFVFPTPPNINCSTNIPATDLCTTAPQISNLNGYCGNTKGLYTVSTSDPSGVSFCGNLENTSWLKFIASETTAKLNIIVDNCSDNNGIQMRIYETTNCGTGTFTPKSNCWSPSFVQPGIVEASGLTPGNTYYLMIDGYAGDQCDYTIYINSGIQVALNGTYSKTDISCQGVNDGLISVYPIGGVKPYKNFTLSGSSSSSNASGVFTGLAAGTYNVTIEDNSGTTYTINNITIAGTSQTVIVRNDTTICKGSSVTLTSSGATSYSWTAAPLDPTLTSNIASPLVTPTQTTIYTLNAQLNTGRNLIYNGDFELGNEGFGTDYKYLSTNPTGDQKAYGIVNNANTWTNFFPSACTANGGTGNMMVVDGSTVANDTVWYQTVPVTPNTNYTFSYFLQALGINPSARIDVLINGAFVGNFNPGAVCSWQQLTYTWNSGAATNAKISIIDREISGPGNDFAIDNLSFTANTICTVAKSVTINVTDQVTPSFNAIAPVCIGGSFTLPSTSTNGITGTWSPSIDNTQTTTYTFKPDAGQCAKDTTMMVVVEAPPSRSFTAGKDSIICDFISYNMMSTGANGFWEVISSNTSGLNISEKTNPKTQIQNDGTCDAYHLVWNEKIGSCTLKDSVWIGFNKRPNVSIMPPDFCKPDIDTSCSLSLAITPQNTSGGICNNICTPKCTPSQFLNILIDTIKKRNAAVQGSISNCRWEWRYVGNFDTIKPKNPPQVKFIPDRFSMNATVTVDTFGIFEFNWVCDVVPQPQCPECNCACSPVAPKYFAFAPPSIIPPLDTVICENNLPYQWEGLTINAGGNYSKNYKNKYGCDSSKTLNLTVTPLKVINEQPVEICPGSAFFWNNQVITSPGIYEFINNCEKRILTVIFNFRPPSLFNQISPICLGQPFSLPSVSLDGRSGFWSPSPNTTATTTYTFFEFSGGANCPSATMTVIVNLPPTANAGSALGPICNQGGISIPMNGSVLGSATGGVWSGGKGIWINPNDPFNATYTPDPSESGNVLLTLTTIGGVCGPADVSSKTINLIKEIIPTFNAVASICSGDNFTLPSSSEEGIKGTWSPAINNTTTTTYTFTPTSGQCATSSTMTVAVRQKQVPAFNNYGPFCQNAPITLPILPSTSNNGITGSWSPVSLSTTVAGNIQYSFTPAVNECATPASISVVVNPELPSIFTQVQPICNGGTFTLPTRSNNGITGTWSPAIDNTKTTTYTFTPTVGQCAKDTTMTVVVNPLPLEPTLSATQPDCNNTTGSLTISGLPSGSWTINPGNISGSGNSYQINNVSPNTYSYTVTDASDCTSPLSSSVTINNVPPRPTVPVAEITQQPDCNNVSGTITISSPAGNNIRYTANGGTPQSLNIFSGLNPGNYIFIASDVSTGCVSNPSPAVLLNNPPPVSPPPVVGVSERYCAGASAVPLRALGQNLQWYTSASGGTGSTAAPVPSTQSSGITIYYVTQRLTGYCESPREPLNVIILPSPVADAGSDKEVIEGNRVQLDGSASGNGIDIIWTPGEKLSNAKIENPFASPESTTVYTLEVKSLDGCISKDQVRVVVKPAKPVNIPNVFSPNGDGFNDRWVITNIEDYPDAEIQIFNRYGTKVYEVQGYRNANGWEGKMNGADLPVGPYYYIIRLNKKLKQLAGAVSIIR